MRTLLLLACVASFSLVYGQGKKPQVQKPSLPLITTGTTLVYGLYNWDETSKATLIIKITDVTKGIAFDFMIIDAEQRQKNGQMFHSKKDLGQIDTIAGLRYISEPGGIEFNYLSIWLSQNNFKKAMKGEQISINLENGNDMKLQKSHESDFDVNIHQRLWNRDTAFTSQAYYTHGKKMKLRSVDLLNVGSEEGIMEIWNNPSQPLILSYNLPGIGSIKLEAIL